MGPEGLDEEKRDRRSGPLLVARVRESLRETEREGNMARVGLR
jgi:hypothetical protein